MKSPRKPRETVYTALARSLDPQTAQDAASSFDASALVFRVYHCLRDNGPMTSREIAIFIGAEYCYVSPRMKDMERRGLVLRTNTVRANPRSGKDAILWQALLPPFIVQPFIKRTNRTTDHDTDSPDLH